MLRTDWSNFNTVLRDMNEDEIADAVKYYPDISIQDKFGFLLLHYVCLFCEPVNTNILRALISVYPEGLLRIAHVRKSFTPLLSPGYYTPLSILESLGKLYAFEAIWYSCKIIHRHYSLMWTEQMKSLPSLAGNTELHLVLSTKTYVNPIQIEYLLKVQPDSVWIVNMSGRTPFETAKFYNRDEAILRRILITMKSRECKQKRQVWDTCGGGSPPTIQRKLGNSEVINYNMKIFILVNV